ncbi:hypothetical protein ACOSQ4_004214 [Xanthoceras sorbifolium]
MYVHAKRARKPISFDGHTTLSDMHSDGVEAGTTGSSSSLKNKLGELVAMEVELDTGQCRTRWKRLARGETPPMRISMVGVGSKHLGSKPVVGDAGVMKKNKLNVEVMDNELQSLPSRQHMEAVLDTVGQQRFPPAVRFLNEQFTSE